MRFSVRGLIVVVLLAGGWLGWIVRSARIQREAVAAIEKAGGSIFYNWTWSNGRFVPRGKPWAPRRLVDSVGIDYFGHVTAVWLIESTDTTIAHVGRLARLQQFQIKSRSSISDAGLAHLQGLTELTELDLRGAPITDAGLAHLKGLTELNTLYLYNSRVTNAGMAEVKRVLPSLEIFH